MTRVLACTLREREQESSCSIALSRTVHTNCMHLCSVALGSSAGVAARVAVYV